MYHLPCAKLVVLVARAGMMNRAQTLPLSIFKSSEADR